MESSNGCIHNGFERHEQFPEVILAAVREEKAEILVYICAFSSQAIFHGVLRIERRGRVSLLPGPIERNLISGGICERE